MATIRKIRGIIGGRIMVAFAMLCTFLWMAGFFPEEQVDYPRFRNDTATYTQSFQHNERTAEAIDPAETTMEQLNTDSAIDVLADIEQQARHNGHKNAKQRPD